MDVEVGIVSLVFLGFAKGFQNFSLMLIKSLHPVEFLVVVFNDLRFDVFPFTTCNFSVVRQEQLSDCKNADKSKS